MPLVPFVKATACGNDFLIVESSAGISDLAGFTHHVCDRRNGIGADGVEWIVPANGADVAIRLLNADGSEAEISGNGTRCVAAWYCARTPSDSVNIRTGAGLKTCTLVSRREMTFEFRSAMGKPEVGGQLYLGLLEGEAGGVTVSMGNPHYVMHVEEFGPEWQGTAEEVSTHRSFPQGTNVELVKIMNEHEIEARFWERGVGETMSSGTGSCAAAVASIHLGLAKSPVRVHAPGGTQIVEWTEQVFLTGPATLLCRGEFFI